MTGSEDESARIGDVPDYQSRVIGAGGPHPTAVPGQ